MARLPLVLPVIYVIVIGLFAVQTVQAIKCYECTSSKDVHCTENVDMTNTNLELTDCSYIYGAQYCVKTTGMFKGEVGTTRFCSSENLGNICDFQQRMGDVRAYRACFLTCSRDGCNSASSAVASLLVVVGLLATQFVYQRL